MIAATTSRLADLRQAPGRFVVPFARPSSERRVARHPRGCVEAAGSNGGGQSVQHLAIVGLGLHGRNLGRRSAAVSENPTPSISQVQR